MSTTPSTKGTPAGSFVIRFELEEGRRVFAGLYKGAWGIAPTVDTAEVFPTKGEAQRVLRNAYGEGYRPYGKVVRLR